MVKILYAIGDPTTRDAIRVAVGQFKGFEADFVARAEVAERLRERQYHVVFLEDQPDPGAALECLEELSRDEGRLPAVFIADEASIKSLLPDKKRLNISAFLRKPLDPVEVFRLLSRLRERIDAIDLTTG